MTQENIIWIESAWDAFYWNASEGDYESCKLIIADAKDIDVKVAEAMQTYLLSRPIHSFMIPSPILV